MKVKITDYETAKAKVLAREQNPCIANERHVYGVDKTWAGWGQVRDVSKRIGYFRDVEDGYDLPLTKSLTKAYLDTAKLLTMKVLFFIAARMLESALFLITITSIITRW